jgi:hypothetical protein
VGITKVPQLCVQMLDQMPQGHVHHGYTLLCWFTACARYGQV